MRRGWHGRAEDGHRLDDCNIHFCIPTGTCVNTLTHTQMQAHTHIYTHLKPHVLAWLRRYFDIFGNSNPNISVMKQALRLCRTGCGRRVSTARSFLCRICFAKQAVLSGSRSSGNKYPIRPGNTGNSGNSSAKEHCTMPGIECVGRARRSQAQLALSMLLLTKSLWSRCSKDHLPGAPRLYET